MVVSGLASFCLRSGHGFQELPRLGEVVAILYIEAERGGETALVPGGVKCGLGSFELAELLDETGRKAVGDCGSWGCGYWV